MKTIGWVLVLFYMVWFSGSARCQETTAPEVFQAPEKRVVLLQPTGETRNDLPVMRILEDTTAAYKTVMRHIEGSFIHTFLDLHFLAQNNLRNTGRLDLPEPAYLALTNKDGGFAKFGFVLETPSGDVVKPDAPYVDITLDRATAPPDRLMSFTQLYPHEVGHVFVHLLCSEDSVSSNTRSVDMHFFSVVTDYSTAFNEGFAEHIENVSRTLEQNDSIRAGIQADVEKIRLSTAASTGGFRRDFIYPWRLGYYKASMLNWFQKFEDYKRYQYAYNGDIRYKNATLPLSDPEDRLTYRNSGVEIDRANMRNLVQRCASEGAVSAFFTQLFASDLPERYREPAFYRPFLSDTNTIVQTPETYFSPLQNQFMKYFYVMSNYVVENNSAKAQLIDFIDGYMETFPGEAATVRAVFRQALGTEYSNTLPPPMWVLVKEHAHRLLTFDPFGAITVPFYTFDLNAAETEDLLTIPGIDSDAAAIIVRYREAHGFFTDWEQVKAIPGLPEGTADRITDARFDAEYAENELEEIESKLNLSTLLVSPLKYIFFRAAVYFLILFGGLYYVAIRPQHPTTKQVVWLGLRYLLLGLLFVTVGLVAVFLKGNGAWLYILACTAVCALLTLLLYRKSNLRKYRALGFIGAMSVVVLLSAW
ncbi:MAG: helix-hairpin-helix domain-containing protein [Bacteroidetes bacterium]|nr:MAG: helix-hairpin-helix domain-containing protein [Bacteroidota bacterium]